MGLEWDLKSKKRRDFTIRNYKDFNFSRYFGLDLEVLNKVYESMHDGKEWDTIEHETELFD